MFWKDYDKEPNWHLMFGLCKYEILGKAFQDGVPRAIGGWDVCYSVSSVQGDGDPEQNNFNHASNWGCKQGWGWRSSRCLSQWQSCRIKLEGDKRRPIVGAVFPPLMISVEPVRLDSSCADVGDSPESGWIRGLSPSVPSCFLLPASERLYFHLHEWKWGVSLVQKNH